MRLHYHPLSPYSRKASTAIALRGDDVELVVIDVIGGGLKTPAFKALSPFGKMPVLEADEAGTIVESTSILEWLEEQGPRVLLPPGVERVARHFDRLGDFYLIHSVAALWWEPESETGKKAADTARTAWSLFAKQLEKSGPFVTGEAFTLGDLGAAIATDYFQRLGVEAPSTIRAWCDRCFAIPAMKESREAAEPFVKKTLGDRAR